MKFPLNILVLILSAVVLYSAPVKDVNNSVGEYNSAKELLVNKNYQEAYDKFYKMFLNDLSNPDINFHLGQSAFMLNHFDEAISAYERILFLDENAVRVKLELAKCYIAKKSNEQAKVIFLEVLRLDIPEKVKKNIHKYLELLDDKKVKNTLNAILIFGFGWDDNVESLSTNYVSDITDGTFISTNSLKSAITHQEVLILNDTYKYSDTLSIKNDGLVFLKNNVGLSQRNIQFIQYSPALSFKYSKQLNVIYSLLYNHIWLDKTALLTNYAIDTKFKYINSKSLVFGGSLKYQQKLNSDTKSNNRDAAYYEMLLNAQMIHSDKFSTLSDIKFSRERKIRGTLSDVDYDLYNLSVALKYKYTNKLALSLKTKLFHKPYLDKYIESKTNRVDDEYQLYLGTTYALSKKYILQTEYIYTDHNSNYNDFEFKKNQLNLNFISIF